MNFTKFEEKARDFINEHGLFVPEDTSTVEAVEVNYDKQFYIGVSSGYKNKSLTFYMLGAEDFNFTVSATTLDDMFDKAYKVLKGFAPKATRKKGE